MVPTKFIVTSEDLAKWLGVKRRSLYPILSKYGIKTQKEYFPKFIDMLVKKQLEKEKIKLKKELKLAVKLKKGNRYYFENRKCSKYPCHRNMYHMNCLFCFCPLYSICENSGEGCKVCTFVHERDSYYQVTRILKSKGLMEDFGVEYEEDENGNLRTKHRGTSKTSRAKTEISTESVRE